MPQFQASIGIGRARVQKTSETKTEKRKKPLDIQVFSRIRKTMKKPQ